jgi:hypothetical protein
MVDIAHTHTHTLAMHIYPHSLFYTHVCTLAHISNMIRNIMV